MFYREEEDQEGLEKVLKLKDDEQARLVKAVITEVRKVVCVGIYEKALHAFI